MATPLKIVLAVAEAGDTVLLKRTFAKARLKAVLHFVEDGQEAVDYLHRKLAPLKSGPQALPDLLVLDLALPRLDGFGVLGWLKQRPRLNRMLVLAFSESGAPDEARRAYDLGADAVVLKPRDRESALEVIHQIEQHWLRLNATPECGCESAWD